MEEYVLMKPWQKPSLSQKISSLIKIVACAALVIVVGSTMLRAAQWFMTNINQATDGGLIVTPLNASPAEVYPEMRNFWPREKELTIYRYQFVGSAPTGFVADDYLKKHPHDALMVHISHSSGEIAVEVFSNELPDIAFFPKYEIQEKR
jgi:hypothetical protein